MLATGDNNATAQANGGAGSLGLSLGVMIPTAKIGGAVKASFDGILIAATLNVLAKGENTATSTAVVASASALAAARAPGHSPR